MTLVTEPRIDAKEHGYSVQFEPIGDFDPDLGAPTQMAVFDKCA